MASLETLSDSELRRKLGEYGYDLGPVTDTTREIFFKKLKHVMEKAAGSEVTGKKNRRSLSRFSSGEEESEADDDSLTMPPPASKNTPRSSSRRKSSGAKPNVSSPKITTKIEGNSRDSSDGGQREYTSKTRATNAIIPGLSDSNHSTVGIRSRRSTRSTNESFMESQNSLIRDGFETGSDSDVANDEPVSADILDGISSSRSYLSSVSSRLGFSSERTNVSNTYEPRKRLPTKSDTRPYTPNGHHNFSSSFSSQKAPSPASTSTTPLPPSHPLSSFSIPNKQRSTTMISTQFGTVATPVEEEKKLWDSQFVSMVLLGVAALFFLAIGLTYMSVRYKDSSISSALDAVSQDGSSKDNNFPICNKVGESKENCVAKIDIQPAIELFRLLHPWLEELAAKAHCEGGWFGNSETVDAAFVPHSKAMEFLVRATDNTKTPQEIAQQLENLKIIMANNPHWGVKVVSAAETIAAGLKGDKIEEYYVVSDPSLPWGCILRLKLKGLLISAVVVTGGFVTLWWSQVGISWYLRRKERHQKEVYQLVEQALALLSAHQQHKLSLGGGTEAAAAGEGTYLAINHVRDQLIPPSERQKKAALWEEVVQFLEERESRVRMEVQMVSGEEFRVWRWLPSPSPPTPPASHSTPIKSASPLTQASGTISQPSFATTYSPSATASSNSLHRSQVGLNHHHQSQQQTQKRKVWQGQAFETMEGSVNSLPCSPTPCLKIRHMFDPEIEYGEAWVVATEDAVLEKCEESGAAVVHVAVDRSSAEGCVYIKCASRADAGRAYRGMHGWWFDGNLVTVKYLRLERYHERFPEAAGIPPNGTTSTPLPSLLHRRPSNNKRLSLQGRHWQSPIERT